MSTNLNARAWTRGPWTAGKLESELGMGQGVGDATQPAADLAAGLIKAFRASDPLTSEEAEHLPAAIARWQEDQTDTTWRVTVANEGQALVVIDLSRVPIDDTGEPDYGNADWPSDEEISGRLSKMLDRTVTVTFYDGVAENPPQPWVAEALYDYADLPAEEL